MTTPCSRNLEATSGVKATRASWTKDSFSTPILSGIRRLRALRVFGGRCGGATRQAESASLLAGDDDTRVPRRPLNLGDLSVKLGAFRARWCLDARTGAHAKPR